MDLLMIPGGEFSGIGDGKNSTTTHTDFYLDDLFAVWS